MTDAANIAATSKAREERTVNAANLAPPADRLARVVAVGVFALGVVMILMVFQWTRAWFDALADANQAWLKQPATPGTEPGVTDYLPAFGAQLLRALLLFVLGFLASSVATKGAQLYAAAASRARDSADLP